MSGKCSSVRAIIAIMIFTGCCVNYTMRINLSINIVAMSPVTTANQTAESSASLNWSAYDKANILGAYFWGYMLSSAIGGPIAEQWGPRLIMAVTTLLSGVLTCFTPLVAKESVVMMFIIRVVIGFLGGFLMPTMHVLIGHWAVPEEKGKFTGALIAGTVGTSVAWTTCGVIIEKFGWEWAFYIFAIVGFIWTIAYWFLVHDSPQNHSFVQDKEKQYICQNITLKREKTKTPFIAILTSIPVWSQMLMSFGSGWGVYFVLTAVPSYIAHVLGFSISSTGFLASITYLARSISALLFGAVGDFLIKKKFLSVRWTRILMCLFSHIIPGTMLLILSHMEITAATSILIITVAMAMNGAKAVSIDANVHDLTSYYSGTVSGFNTAIGNIAGVVCPLITAYFTKADETDGELWRPVFYVGASLYIITGLQYFIFGSSELQSWNDSSSKQKDTSKS